MGKRLPLHPHLGKESMGILGGGLTEDLGGWLPQTESVITYIGSTV